MGGLPRQCQKGSVHRPKPSVWSRSTPLLLQLLGHVQVCQYFFSYQAVVRQYCVLCCQSCCSQHPCCSCSVLSLLLPVSWFLETGKQGPLGRVHFCPSSASSGKVAQESVSQAACITDPEKRSGIWNSYGEHVGPIIALTYYQSGLPSRTCSPSGIGRHGSWNLGIVESVT